MPDAPGNSKSIWKFDPRAIPGCQTWLDATDSNTITYSSGSNVSVWKDKAVYGNNAVRLQGTPTRSATGINGLPAMYLDGSNATSAAFTGTCPPNTTNQLTVFVVFTVESGTADTARLFSLMYPDNYSNSMFPLGYSTGSNTLHMERNSVSYNGTSNVLSFGTPTLAACTVNGSAGTIHMNGTQILSASVFNSSFEYTYYTIGCFGQARGVNDSGVSPWNGLCWKGYVGEVILYSNALSTEQRQQVEGYLAWKWGFNPLPFYTTFSYTGALQSYVVPAGATSTYVYMWGAGGGGLNGGNEGGAGAYIQGALATTPGETLSILVGGGGKFGGNSTTNPVPAQGGYGGGGNANSGGGTYSGGPSTSFGNGSAGGGRSAIQRSGTDVVTAGGGGGSGYGQGGPATWQGTAIHGNYNWPNNDGAGGSQTAGGAAGINGNPTSFGLATAGSQFQGGNGNNYGGGGGGGWYGGGGGSTTSGYGAAGGGGSSYTSNLTSATGLDASSGSYPAAPGQSLSFYVSGVATGSNTSYGGSGGPGLVVLSSSPLTGISSVINLPSSHPFYRTRPFLRTSRPTDIDGCALWLDGADTTTLSPSGVGTGSNVTQWNDKSGNNYHAVGYNNTATYTATGLNGLPALTFSSTKSMVSPVPAGTFPTAISVFVVYQFTGTLSSSAVYSLINRTFSSGSAYAAPFSVYQNNSSMVRYIGIGTNQLYSSVTGTTFTNTTPSIYYFNIASNSNTVWNESVNGTATAYTLTNGTAGYADTASNVCIGGRLDTAVYMDGVISEVIMYNSALTSAQRQQVETYLIRKWGIPTPKVGVSSTTPSLTNCKLWVDGADILGTGAPAPAIITTWADKSGTGNTVTANSLTTGQAIASSPMGAFMNGACYFSITGGLVGSIANSPFVIFIVETPAAYTGGTYFMFGNDSIPSPATNNALHIGYRNNGDFTFAFYANDIEVVQTFPNGVTRVWALYMPSSGNRNVRLNGSVVATGNTTQLGTFNAPVIGRLWGSYNDAYYGTISEILVYSGDIGVTAIQAVESYLIAKWQPGTLVPKFTIPAGIGLPFSPLNITGCCLWLDGNDPAGTGVQPSAGALATWKDKSGSSNHMTAAGTSPTFSNFPPGAVTFGGAGYYSNATPVFSNIYTAFFVYKQTASAGPLYTTGATSGSNGLFPNDYGSTYFTRGDSTWSMTSSVFASNVVNLAVTSFSSNVAGSNQYLYYNGSNVVTTTQSNTITYTNFLLGSRQSGGAAYFTGNMYEVIGYSGTLTTGLRQRVEGYLAQKWKF